MQFFCFINFKTLSKHRYFFENLLQIFFKVYFKFTLFHAIALVHYCNKTIYLELFFFLCTKILKIKGKFCQTILSRYK